MLSYPQQKIGLRPATILQNHKPKKDNKSVIDAEVNYLDDEITVVEQEPSTFAELVGLLGSEAAVSKEVVDNIRYRNKHPRVYKQASKELAELVLPRSVKSEKEMTDGTKKQVFDSYINHVRECFTKDPKMTTAIVTRIAKELPLYVKGDRTGLGGRISQAALDMANGFFAEGDDVVELKVTKIEELVPNYKVDRDEEKCVTPESLARGIQTLQRHLQKQATEQAKGMLA